MPNLDKKTFSFQRWSYDAAAKKWRRLEGGTFSSRSKTLKGLARSVQKFVPHVNKNTDFVLFWGNAFYDREQFVRGIWCPSLKIEEGFKCDSPEDMPLGYVSLRTSCVRYIERNCHERVR